MLLSHAPEVPTESDGSDIRQHGHPVTVALPFPHDDLVPLEVDVLHPQSQAFEKPQSTSVQESCRDPLPAAHLPEYGAHLGCREHDREPPGSPGASDPLRRSQVHPQHFPVQEQEGARCLVLGGGRNPALHREVRQVIRHLLPAQRTWIRRTVESEVAADPPRVRFLGAEAQLPRADFTADDVEKFWDEITFDDGQRFFDYKHAETGAEILKAQHPEYELWSQGIHARSGVACADCHMPYQREGASKVSDHWVRSPLLNVNRACQTCHHFSEKELLDRVDKIQETNFNMLQRAGRALMAQPRLLLLDEPSLGLAPLITDEIFSIIRQLSRSGVTILLVEQNAARALSASHKAFLMAGGRIVEQGLSEDLLVDPKLRAAFLGAASAEKPEASRLGAAGLTNIRLEKDNMHQQTFMPDFPDASSLATHQLKGLQWTVQHAYEGSSFYRQHLDAAGVALTDRGNIDIDEQMRTNMPNIYAIGDVATHSSEGFDDLPVEPILIIRARSLD